MKTQKQDFICTDADDGAIYMNVEPNGVDELGIEIKGRETDSLIFISKYDAIDLANFILNKFA